MDGSDLKKLALFRLPVGTIAGIRVTVHWTLFLAGLALLGMFHANPRFGMILVLIVFGSIFLHEMGHCFGARHVGGRANEVILWPLGGLAPLEVEVRPWPLFFSTIMGPAVNVALALVGIALLLVMGGSLAWLFAPPLEVASSLALQVAWALAFINIVLAFFNLIPAFPLDGGRIFHTALWPRFGFEQALKIAIVLGYVCAAGFVVYGLWTRDLLLVAVGAFVAFGAYQERKALEQGHMLGQEERSPWAESLPYYDPQPEREPRKPGVIARWREERQRKREAEEAERKAAMRQRLDEVLKKVSEVGGVNNLSAEERRFLEEASAELRKERSS